MLERAGTGLSVESMIEAARRSANGESFQTVMRDEDFRAGIIATLQAGRPPLVSIELLLRIFESFSAVDAASLEKATRILRRLIEEGYMVAHEDDGWFCCRKLIKSEETMAECDSLHEILDGYHVSTGG
jgi:hypothetical protein